MKLSANCETVDETETFMFSLSIFDYNSGRSQMGKGTEKRRRGKGRRKRGSREREGGGVIGKAVGEEREERRKWRGHVLHMCFIRAGHNYYT